MKVEKGEIKKLKADERQNLGGFNQLMAWWTSEDKRPQYGLAEKDDYLAIEKNKKDELLVRAGQLRGCVRDTAQTIGMSGMAFVSRIFIKGPMKLQGELTERLIPVNISTFAGGKPISSVSYHEAVYPGWQLETEIEFPTRDISVEDFEDLIKRAGNKGLGASHSLGYGTFGVIEFEVLGKIGKQ